MAATRCNSLRLAGRARWRWAAAAYTAASDALAIKFRKLGVPEAEATRRAAMLVIAAEGAVLIARARRSTEPLLLIAEQLKSPEA